MNICRKYRVLMLVILDVILINLSYMFAFFVKYNTMIPNELKPKFFVNMIVVTGVYLICFKFAKLYESLWTIAGIDEFLFGVIGCVSGFIINEIISMIINNRVSLLMNLVAGIFILIFVLGFRMYLRIYRRLVLFFNEKTSIGGRSRRVLIVGAGSAGLMAIREMRRRFDMGYIPVALVDDNSYKIGNSLCGVKVLGDRKDINKIVIDKGINLILIAIPSLNGNEKKELIRVCQKAKVKVKIMPGLYEMINEDFKIHKIRDVDVRDLLGRDEIKLNYQNISEYIENKTILVTGGGGSIGSELCRQIAKFKPKKLLILDIYENNAYDLQNELKRKFPKLNQVALIASVRDKNRLNSIFKKYKPDVIFHAAAHKHVPLMEFNPTEAIKNNVFGTYNVAQCAKNYNVGKFVLISTDKAVNPTNIMGATKRICEMIIQAFNVKSQTEFVAVRFGNVLGSNGSVIPLFKQQIEDGGPVTVTHKEITRYFMLIPEAAQLVIQAGAYAKGGEIFVLDMGSSVKIYDLAKDLIKLSGLEPEKDIAIKVIGLRPGEKLYEELLMAEEGLKKTEHNKIFIGKPTFSDLDSLLEKFNELEEIVKKEDFLGIFNKVEEIVPTYSKDAKQLIAVTK